MRPLASLGKAYRQTYRDSLGSDGRTLVSADRLRQLKRLLSPDIGDLTTHEPLNAECFGTFVQAFIGPAGEDGEESFDFILGTPSWLASREVPIMLGEHHLIVQRYDYQLLVAFIEEFCSRCEGQTWAVESPGSANLRGAGWSHPRPSAMRSQ